MEISLLPCLIIRFMFQDYIAKDNADLRDRLEKDKAALKAKMDEDAQRQWREREDIRNKLAGSNIQN